MLFRSSLFDGLRKLLIEFPKLSGPSSEKAWHKDCDNEYIQYAFDDRCNDLRLFSVRPSRTVSINHKVMPRQWDRHSSDPGYTYILCAGRDRVLSGLLDRYVLDWEFCVADDRLMSRKMDAIR